MTDRRIVVTGAGVISSFGCNIEGFWECIKSGHSAISSLKGDLFASLPSRVATIIPPDKFNIDNYVSAKNQKRMDRCVALAVAASTEAVNDSGLSDCQSLDKDRVGVLIGSGIGGIGTIERNALVAHTNPRRVSPFFIPGSLINIASGHVSIKYGFTGTNDSGVAACATGGQVLASASRIIRCDEADVMVAGGTEASITKLAMAGFTAIKSLSTNFNDCPERASRPWDVDRDGFVMGEGSGVLILEEYEHAKKRGAKVYAELLGYGASGDAHHITAPPADGKGAARAMQLALKKANLSSSDIAYINAHGTSTPLGDLVEVLAIKKVFGDYAYKLAVSSTKSAIGHTLGASGAIEAIVAIMAMRDSVAPPTLNLDKPGEGCDLNFVPHSSQDCAMKYVMSNSFGFGGTNISVIFGSV